MIPSVQTCIGCHQLVAATKPEVQKIRKAWDEKVPIRWTKVNVLPDFVYFNHQPHIMKNIPCQKCHGEIQTMSEVAPPFKLADMSYCVGCHRDNNASIDCYTCHR
jgi:c(7)-type cytochrome triheme protein